MQKIIKLIFILGLASFIAPVGAVEKTAVSPTPFAAVSQSGVVRPADSARVLRSALERPGAPENPDYYFSMHRTPQASGWELLLGVLLTGVFIVHRRMSGR